MDESMSLQCSNSHLSVIHGINIMSSMRLNLLNDTCSSKNLPAG